ncbi:hypothetical protein [Flavobacterium gelatinilyticum]|uniref:hypothetical protein n=1 Tax=Flavobacterium gelatinilyticum TaxID=3003260 RepID=UPI0024815AB9|nr:hypothetical protein [Flavobacterium gelatinilyticum]
MRQKLTKYSLAAITILFLVYKVNLEFALGIDTFFVNSLPSKKLPAEFLNYKNLSQVKNFSNHDVILFNKNSWDYPSSSCLVLEVSKEQIIVKIIDKKEPYDHGGGNTGQNFFNTVFKMDTSGNILDTLNFKTSTSNESDFGDTFLLNKQIVNKDLLFYQTWPTDGNKAKKNFIPVNKDLTWNQEKLLKYYRETILPNCVYLDNFYAWRDSSIPADKKSSVLYFAYNDWYVMYGIPNEIFKDVLNQKKKIINENLLNKIPSERIVFKHFQKLDYNSNVMGRTQSNDTYTYYYWNAVAYINILFKKDTLKFKKEDVFISDYDTNKKSIYSTVKDTPKELEKSLRLGYAFYTNPFLKFTLIHDKEKGRLYLIKKIE